MAGGGGPLLSAPPRDLSKKQSAIPGALFLNRDGNQVKKAVQATPFQLGETSVRHKTSR